MSSVENEGIPQDEVGGTGEISNELAFGEEVIFVCN